MIYRNGVYIPPFDDTPTNAEVDKGTTSDYAFDHAAAADPHPNLTAANLVSHGKDQHTDVARDWFYPVGIGGTGTAGSSEGLPCEDLAAGVDQYAFVGFKVPSYLVSFIALDLIWDITSQGVAGQDWVCDPYSTYGGAASVGTPKPQHVDNPALSVIDIPTLSRRYRTDIGFTMANLALGDYVGIYIKRDGDHASDTYVTYGIKILGVYLTYTASE